MRKRFIICIFLISTIFLLVGCSKKESDFKLQIKESSWSGLSEDYKSNEVTHKYDIVLGKDYNIDNGRLGFKVIKINSDSIIIETKETYSDDENGIDLNSTKKKFEVFDDKEIKLTSTTMDAGYIYYLKLVK